MHKMILLIKIICIDVCGIKLNFVIHQYIQKLRVRFEKFFIRSVFIFKFERLIIKIFDRNCRKD